MKMKPSSPRRGEKYVTYYGQVRVYTVRVHVLERTLYCIAANPPNINQPGFIFCCARAKLIAYTCSTLYPLATMSHLWYVAKESDSLQEIYIIYYYNDEVESFNLLSHWNGSSKLTSPHRL